MSVTPWLDEIGMGLAKFGLPSLGAIVKLTLPLVFLQLKFTVAVVFIGMPVEGLSLMLISLDPLGAIVSGFHPSNSSSVMKGPTFIGSATLAKSVFMLAIGQDWTATQ
jgi:hypothetical protein